MFKLRLLALASASLSVLLFARSNAETLTEDFYTNPANRGWRTWGDTNFFQWDPTNQNLRVTWDSRQTNSYCYWPLGTTLARDDDFSLTFKLRLEDFTPGINPAKANSPFQISVGLVRLADATAPGFIRGSGFESPNLAEFSFFPDPGGQWQWGPSLTVMLCDNTGFNWSSGGFAPYALATNDVYQIAMAYSATNGILNAHILRNGQPFVTMPPAVLGANFTAFRFDTLAVCSYSDAGQWPGYEGSILAHGTVDDFVLTLPPPVSNLAGEWANNIWEVRFASRSNWLYTFERTTDFVIWTNLFSGVNGTGSMLIMQDTNPLAGKAFYRVRAQRP